MTVVPSPSSWKSQNLSKIQSRLEPHLLSEKLETIIQGDIQGIFLHKENDVLAMYCYDNKSHQLSNIMSRIDLGNPLNLLGAYSQAVFLTGFWQEEPPESVYIAGFGGGRLAMLFNHYFSNMTLHGSDIDSNVLAVSRDYFGLDAETMKQVTARDSREDLQARDTLYDILFLDVFVGGGEHVNHLSTVEFFRLCREKMTDNGVLVANLVIIDPLMHQKIASIQSVFNQVHVWEYNGAHVVFASDKVFNQQALRERVMDFQTHESLDFNLLEKVDALKAVEQDQSVKPLLDNDLQSKQS